MLWKALAIKFIISERGIFSTSSCHLGSSNGTPFMSAKVSSEVVSPKVRPEMSSFVPSGMKSLSMISSRRLPSFIPQPV